MINIVLMLLYYINSHNSIFNTNMDININSYKVKYFCI